MKEDCLPIPITVLRQWVERDEELQREIFSLRNAYDAASQALDDLCDARYKERKKHSEGEDSYDNYLHLALENLWRK